MAENNVNLKIFLIDENLNEARRISVDASVATSYLFMKEKLETVFPNLRNAQFKITWKDSDGDEITIASDEDFITAFTEMSNNVKVLTIRVIQRCPEPTEFTSHLNEEAPTSLIICDVCDKTVMGFRYKCLQCPDYDLCADCEFQGCHSNHVMVRLPNNDAYSSRCSRKFVHHIARNLKKSAYAASKEAYRASKHASKFAGKCKQSGQPTSSQAERENEAEYSQNCPFNMKDVHALGVLARENLSQLLESLSTAPEAQEGTEKTQQIPVVDVLRNAVDAFFGRCPENQSCDSTKPEENKKPDSEKNVSMEVDPTPSAPVSQNTPNAEAVSIESNSKVPSLQDETKEEAISQPQWTFIASNSQQTQASAPETVQDSQPKVAFIYHENPVIAEGLVKLHEMGFSNETGVLSSLLEHFNGNVSDVVKAIFDKKI